MRGIHRLIYRALLLAYPRSFREDYGHELALQLEDELRERPALAVWYRLLPDTLQAAITRHLDLFRQDIRLAVRMYRLHPWTSALIVALLGLGVGATLAAFEAAYSLVARPLPYPGGERLIVIHNFPTFLFREEPSRLRDLTGQDGPIEGAVIYVQGDVNLSGGPLPIRVQAAEVSPWFFSFLQRSPYLGAWFSANAAGGSEAVISYGLWRQLFGGDPGLLGRKIDLNGVPRLIIGVAPPDIDVPHRAALWIGASQGVGTLRLSGAVFYELLGKMKPGATITSTQQALQAFADSLEPRRRSLDAGSRRIPIFTLKQHIAGEWDKAVLLLAAATGVALLLTCCSIANLLLARLVSRRHEVNVRIALGAPVSRLARQFRTEMLCLTLFGVSLAWFVYRNLLVVIARWLPNFPVDLAPSTEALGILAVVAVLITVFLGFAPQAETALLLRGPLEGSREHRPRAAGLLLAVQAALATVLLIGAALFGRSLLQLLGVDLHLNVENVMTASVSLAGTRLDDQARASEYYERALHTIRALPGVRTAAAINYMPLSGAHIMLLRWVARGPQLNPAREFSGSPRIASDDYFDAMGIRMLAGRTLDDRASGRGHPEVVVNRACAEQFGGIQKALGNEITMRLNANPSAPNPQEQTQWARIVGVIDDVRFWGPAAYQPIPEIYQSYQAAQWPTMNFVVKLVPPEVGPERIRAALNAADPRVTVYDVRTLRSHLNENLARPRLIIIVLGSFALFSWLLALLALAGLVAHDVRRSHPEIGIRMAVGASNWHVLALFLKRHSAPVLAGTIVGVCVSSGASSMIRSLLFEVSPLDTLVYAAVPAGLLAVAVVVTLAASFRATRVNPAVALRSE